MSLLLDENLSSLFPGMIHVRDVGLKQASDEVIRSWASRKSCTIVTTDADFAGLSRRLEWPPKVIHLEECDSPSALSRNYSGRIPSGFRNLRKIRVPACWVYTSPPTRVSGQPALPPSGS